jgi:hypothetical protein
VTVNAQDILTNSGLGKRKVLTIPKGSMFNALLALYEAYEVSIIADPYSLQRANEISLIDDIQIDNITFLEAMIMILGVNQSKGWTVLVNNDAVASGRRQIGFQLFE